MCKSCLGQTGNAHEVDAMHNFSIKLFGKTISVPFLSKNAANGSDEDRRSSSTVDVFIHKENVRKRPAPTATSLQTEIICDRKLQPVNLSNRKEKMLKTENSYDRKGKSTEFVGDRKEKTSKTDNFARERSSKLEKIGDGKAEKAQKIAENCPVKPEKPVACPRCRSVETKFCYFNNYNVNQPRHFCKNCRRYWTAGGSMRNIPVGAGRRKSKHFSAFQQNNKGFESVNLQEQQINFTNIKESVDETEMFTVGICPNSINDESTCGSSVTGIALTEMKDGVEETDGVNSVELLGSFPFNGFSGTGISRPGFGGGLMDTDGNVGMQGIGFGKFSEGKDISIVNDGLALCTRSDCTQQENIE